ncbi:MULTISPECIES: Holliday junction branch migration protein RuvA [Arthrobacter]|uniref:Holliday junction branch migration complex subunit RuvA n=1 Tax=Arthrobacter psychrochitiniphilus TaxID=291045 RepID=A0A2V3DQI1_9MICC|nr:MULTISPECIES: Holliday junction branch migration protein RuvA [Arthrobacter]NYG17728.1 Holliday junction DNA helicase RuvA [Arthrobacter psychrochitiniphilus]PXA65215.1 Holliday junction branch migration protein RuvA [Arthrobacter psychrochitiniphilus]
MISFVRGPVAALSLSQVVIDVNGVGMLVHATPKTLGALVQGEEASLTTAMIVREDSMTLYGFADVGEREVFDTLLSVSGIGPRLALAILAVLEPESIRLGVDAGDGKVFTKVPGVGPKVAGRIVLELKGKLKPTGEAVSATVAAPAMEWKDQVVAAMTSLGWNERDALKAIDAAVTAEPELAEGANVPAVLRATLRRLGQDNTRGKGGVR